MEPANHGVERAAKLCAKLASYNPPSADKRPELVANLFAPLKPAKLINYENSAGIKAAHRLLELSKLHIIIMFVRAQRTIFNNSL